MRFVLTFIFPIILTNLSYAETCGDIDKKAYPEEYRLCLKKDRGSKSSQVQMIEKGCKKNHRDTSSTEYNSCVKMGIKDYINEDLKSKCDSIDKRTNPNEYSSCIKQEYSENRFAFVENKCSALHGGKDSLEYESCVKKGIKDYINDEFGNENEITTATCSVDKGDGIISCNGVEYVRSGKTASNANRGILKNITNKVLSGSKDQDRSIQK